MNYSLQSVNLVLSTFKTRFSSLIWMIWYDTGLIRSVISNYTQFGENKRQQMCNSKIYFWIKKNPRTLYPRWCPCPWRWARSCRIYKIRCISMYRRKNSITHLDVISYHLKSIFPNNSSFNLQNNDTNLVPKLVEISFAYDAFSWKVISKKLCNSYRQFEIRFLP